MYHYGDVLQPWLTTAGHIASRPMATSFNLVLNSDGEQPPDLADQRRQEVWMERWQEPLISQCSDLCRRRTRIICECMGIVTVDSGGITTVRAIPILSHHQVRCSWVACSVFQGAQSCAFWQVPYRRSPLLNTVCVSRLIRHAPCHMRALFRRSLWHSA